MTDLAKFVGLVYCVQRWSNDVPTTAFMQGKIEAAKILLPDITEMYEWCVAAEHSAAAWKEACDTRDVEIKALRSAIKVVIGRSTNTPWHEVREHDVDVYMQTVNELAKEPK